MFDTTDWILLVCALALALALAIFLLFLLAAVGWAFWQFLKLLGRMVLRGYFWMDGRLKANAQRMRELADPDNPTYDLMPIGKYRVLEGEFGAYAKNELELELDLKNATGIYMQLRPINATGKRDA